MNTTLTVEIAQQRRIQRICPILILKSEEIAKYERQNIIYLISHDHSEVGGRVGGGLV